MATVDLPAPGIPVMQIKSRLPSTIDLSLDRLLQVGIYVND